MGRIKITPKFNKRILVRNLKNLRTWADRTQSQTADLLKIKRPMYAKYEEALNEPGLKIMLLISNLYKLPINDILSREITAREFYRANRYLIK